VDHGMGNAFIPGSKVAHAVINVLIVPLSTGLI